MNLICHNLADLDCSLIGCWQYKQLHLLLYNRSNVDNSDADNFLSYNW